MKNFLSGNKPVIMGILNLTPDSFSDGNKDATLQDFVARAEKLLEDGADVIDVGAESTRPGATPVIIQEELNRLLPFLEAFRKKHPHTVLSLDTRKNAVAEKAMAYKISIINDTTFLSDHRLALTAKQHHAYYVLMHGRGTPQTMGGMTEYKGGLFETIFVEIFMKLKKLEAMQFPLDHVILDPGFGFAKTPDQCVALMDHLDEWRDLSVNYKNPVVMPLMIGISRKRFLQNYSGAVSPLERDEVSANLAVKAYLQGFRLIRTHNVALTRQAFKELL